MKISEARACVDDLRELYAATGESANPADALSRALDVVEAAMALRNAPKASEARMTAACVLVVTLSHFEED